MRSPAVVRTVRFRITFVAALVVALVLAAVGASLLVVQARQLDDDLDESLRRRADDVLAGGVPMADGAPMMLPSSAGDEVVVQVISADGAVVAATENALGVGPIAAAPDSASDVFTTVDALPVEDDEYRILSRAATLDGAEVVVHVAENTDDLRELVGRLRAAVAVAIPIAVVVLAALVWWLVGRTLRPVEAIRTEVAGLGPGQLGRRVPQPDTGDEIDRLAATMNEMLARLDDANRRQQQFVADASHELRSPLARMRTELETGLGGTPQGDVAPSTARSVIEEIDELTALVDDLLVLARSDSGRASAERRPVDLDDLVFDEVEAVRRSGTGVVLDVSDVSAAQVLGEPGELRRVVRNLLDNAVRHGESRVQVALQELAADAGREWAVLTVTDDGPGVPADQAEVVFERFTRLDGARSRGAGGTGLGLAIARDVVERHGGALALDVTHRGGARFVMRLPVNPTS